MTTNEPKTAVPIKLVFDANSLKERSTKLSYSADVPTCETLAAYAGLVDVGRFEVNFDIARSGRFGAKVSGQVRATVTQTCVVSLEPFAAKVEENFEVRFLPAAASKPSNSKKPPDFDVDFEEQVLQVAFDGVDPPEVLHDGKIDLGAIATEYFVLGLDPYPRKPDADLGLVASGIKYLEIGAGPLPVEANSPFSGLAALKDTKKS